MPSTVIASFNYNPTTQELTITFVTGRIYTYYNVPEDVYSHFKIYREKGIFFNKNIRGKFLFKKTKLQE